MSYSKKLESYVSLDELANRFNSSCREEGISGMEDLIWSRVKMKYPRASQDRWDEIYKELDKQMLCEYDIEVEVKITKKKEE